MKNSCCWVNYKWVIIQNQIVILKKKFYETFQTTVLKKEEHVTGVDTTNIRAKSNFIALKAEADNLDINNWLMFPLV